MTTRLRIMQVTKAAIQNVSWRRHHMRSRFNKLPNSISCNIVLAYNPGCDRRMALGGSGRRAEVDITPRNQK
jgi:hypothetical protein